MLNLDNDGIFIKKDFLPSAKVENLLNEVTDFFDNTPSGIPLGVLIQSFNRDSYKYSINSPTLSVKKTNLLEMAVDVFEIVKTESSYSENDWQLTNICIERDTTDDLFWHTDHRKGMLRAFLYLEGGSETSGAFKFMKGTHNRNFHVEHMLTKAQIDKFKDDIYICQGSPGDLVIADTNGFHANMPKKTRRTVVLFEFQPESLEAPKSGIHMRGELITDKVIQNLELFKSKSVGEHGIDARMTKVPNTLSPKGILLPQVRFLMKYFLNYKQKVKVE